MLKSLGKGARALVPQQSGDVGDVEGDKICRPHVFRETGTLLKKREKRKGGREFRESGGNHRFLGMVKYDHIRWESSENCTAFQEIANP